MTRSVVLVLLVILAACSGHGATAAAPTRPAAPPGPPPPPPLPPIQPIAAADLTRFASYRWAMQRGPWGEIMIPDYWQEVPPSLVGVSPPLGSTLAAGWGKRGEYNKWDSLHIFVEHGTSPSTAAPDTLIALVNFTSPPQAWRAPEEARASALGNVRGQVATWRGFGLATYDILDHRNALAGVVQRGDTRYWIICISNNSCTELLGTFAPPST